MMHPTVVAALAAERHADLLRAAEEHRRTTRLARSAPLPGERRGAVTPAGLRMGLRIRLRVRLRARLRARSGRRVIGLARTVRRLTEQRPSSATAPCCA